MTFIMIRLCFNVVCVVMGLVHYGEAQEFAEPIATGKVSNEPMKLEESQALFVSGTNGTITL